MCSTSWCGVSPLNRPNARETNAAARALFAEAAALDEGYADAHAALGGTYIAALNSDYSQDREADLVAAERHLWRALVLDEHNLRAHFWRGVALQFRWRFEEALAEFDLVIAAERGNARAIAARGFVLVATDRFEEAITAFRDAMRVSPLDPSIHRWTWMLGGAIRRLGREEEALPYFIRAASMRPTDQQYRASLVSLYGVLGRSAEAAASLREWRERQPELTVAYFRRQNAGISPYPLWQSTFERFLEGLRLAGMPEE